MTGNREVQVAFSLRRSVYMFLGQGGHKAGADDNPDRGFVVFVSARNPAAAHKECSKALAERGWTGVEILRGGEVPEKPDKQPHDEAWLEARNGKRGIIVYDVKARADGEQDGPSGPT